MDTVFVFTVGGIPSLAVIVALFVDEYRSYRERNPPVLGKFVKSVIIKRK